MCLCLWSAGIKGMPLPLPGKQFQLFHLGKVQMIYTLCASIFKKNYLFIVWTFYLHADLHARRGYQHQIHYRWLWATMWLLGIELRTSRRAVSALNLWAIALALGKTFKQGMKDPVSVWLVELQDVGSDALRLKATDKKLSNNIHASLRQTLNNARQGRN